MQFSCNTVFLQNINTLAFVVGSSTAFGGGNTRLELLLGQTQAFGQTGSVHGLRLIQLDPYGLLVFWSFEFAWLMASLSP